MGSNGCELGEQQFAVCLVCVFSMCVCFFPQSRDRSQAPKIVGVLLVSVLKMPKEEIPSKRDTAANLYPRWFQLSEFIAMPTFQAAVVVVCHPGADSRFNHPQVSDIRTFLLRATTNKSCGESAPWAKQKEQLPWLVEKH